MTRPIRQPKPATIKRYGLTVDQWQAMADGQNHLCVVCKRLPESGTLHIDHAHLPSGGSSLPWSEPGTFEAVLFSVQLPPLREGDDRREGAGRSPVPGRARREGGGGGGE